MRGIIQGMIRVYEPCGKQLHEAINDRLIFMLDDYLASGNVYTDLVPDDITAAEAKDECESIYGLLKAKKSYQPSMLGSYILYRLISHYSETLEESEGSTVWEFDNHDELVASVELLNSDLAKELGMYDATEQRVDVNGTEVRMKVRPWEFES